MDNFRKIIGSVNYDLYAKEPNGTKIPQVSNPIVISNMLDLLEVISGQRVLEIGTGSGYSAALLSYLVGITGRVTSVDIVPELVNRARKLFEQQKISNVNVTEGDGRWISSETPFDRIVAWATAEVLPSNWIDGLTEGGVLVAPIKLLPLTNTNVVIRIRNTKQELYLDKVIDGSFVPLTNTPRREWFGYAEEADIVLFHNNTPVLFLSSQWIKNTNESAEPISLLKNASVDKALSKTVEDINDFRAYLLATKPLGITTAFNKDNGNMIGYSDPNGLALISLRSKYLIISGNREATDIFYQWINNWRNAGRPGFEKIRGTVENTGHAWRVNLFF